MFPLTLCIVWICLCSWKTEVEIPRDFPIRFNRARQRLYAYNFTYRKWNPFERWSVAPVAYDWAQVRAELWRGYHSTGGIVLSIVKPGTNEVIDRFPLTSEWANEHAWAYVHTYMREGPDALPPPDPPRDPDEVRWYDVALLLAPEVKWPEEMDQESRTAP